MNLAFLLMTTTCLSVGQLPPAAAAVPDETCLDGVERPAGLRAAFAPSPVQREQRREACRFMLARRRSRENSAPGSRLRFRLIPGATRTATGISLFHVRPVALTKSCRRLFPMVYPGIERYLCTTHFFVLPFKQTVATRTFFNS